VGDEIEGHMGQEEDADMKIGLLRNCLVFIGRESKDGVGAVLVWLGSRDVIPPIHQ
jgi:hypothetical protein